jgi:hypothetical protein
MLFLSTGLNCGHLSLLGHLGYVVLEAAYQNSLLLSV